MGQFPQTGSTTPTKSWEANPWVGSLITKTEPNLYVGWFPSLGPRVGEREGGGESLVYTEFRERVILSRITINDKI